MESLYVISTLEKAKINEYKLGKHTGPIHQLESRYVASLVNPIVYFFYPYDGAGNIKNLLLKKLREYRILNLGGSITAWVKLDLKKIISEILDIVHGNNNESKISHNDTIKINIYNSDPIHYKYTYSVSHNKKIIGKITLLYETTCDDELRVDSINILSGFEDDNFILLIFNKILDYLDTNYYSVKNYIINSREINCVTDIDDNYSISDQKIDLEVFDREISTNYIDRYYCFNDKHNKWIFLAKQKMNSIKWKKQNICDIMLAFDRDTMSPLNENNDEIMYVNEINKKSDSPLQIKARRKFSIVKEKCYNENNKRNYKIIRVIFDKPITFLGKDSSFIDDIYMKFIVNGRDYTSDNGKISGFSSDYRLNKLKEHFDDNTILLSTGHYMYEISQFYYLASDKDFQISEFGARIRNPYPKLCVMVNKIYNDCK